MRRILLTVYLCLWTAFLYRGTILVGNLREEGIIDPRGLDRVLLLLGPEDIVIVGMALLLVVFVSEGRLTAKVNRHIDVMLFLVSVLFALFFIVAVGRSAFDCH